MPPLARFRAVPMLSVQRCFGVRVAEGERPVREKAGKDKFMQRRLACVRS
jgi:hypothetical protein